MKSSKSIVVPVFSLCVALPAAAVPADALVNNRLSLPGEVTKSVMVESDVSDIRGKVWPFILGVAAVDIAIQAYFYGVYMPATRRG